jgi:hypothetical protein
MSKHKGFHGNPAKSSVLEIFLNCDLRPEEDGSMTPTLGKPSYGITGVDHAMTRWLGTVCVTRTSRDLGRDDALLRGLLAQLKYHYELAEEHEAREYHMTEMRIAETDIFVRITTDNGVTVVEWPDAFSLDESESSHHKQFSWPVLSFPHGAN